MLSPLVAHDPVKLALGATAVFVAGWICWKLDRRAGRRLPRQDQIIPRLDPADRA